MVANEEIMITVDVKEREECRKNHIVPGWEQVRENKG
jgi:hypothetical protein